MTHPTRPPGAAEVIDVAGDGAPWMTMVHGMSQDRRVFSKQVEEFKGRFRLLLVDLPGHGGAADMGGPYGPHEFALGIEAALDEAGVDSSDYWGTHTGASAGLLLAARDPDRFRSLVLEGPVLPDRPMPSVVRAFNRTRAVARESGIEQARKQWFDESEWFAVMRRNPVECRARQQWEMVCDFRGGPWLDQGTAQSVPPVAGLLASLRVPTLVMNGQHDLADFLEVANELEALLPNCRRISVRDGGGFPLWEYPDRVNVEVWKFLDAIAG
ncbi:MAG: hydrolase, alpha/beta fold family [Ramlibacter sp.]|nr:hydrolase, alpha/beta fold family [Ramlibacter sp.]